MPPVYEILRDFSILLVPILLAVTFHELAHGYVADRLGDPTARRAGRLTLNPLAHLDPMGTLVFALTRMIGWARPVPVNPSHFSDARRGMFWVGLAGPAANLALAVVCALVYRGLMRVLPELDVGVVRSFGHPALLIARAGVVVNLGLGLFNLLPIPPLDGGRVAAGVLPAGSARVVAKVERYGFLLLIVVVFSGALEWTLYPVLRLAAGALLGTR